MDPSDEEVREYFKACDTNGDGAIQYSEFVALLHNLGTDIPAEECRIGFEEVDSNGDGLIDFDEFIVWWGEL